MLEAGYTAVGEFHYVHHQADGTPHEDSIATSRAMIRAAKQAGIRINLLYTVYNRGGFGDEPLSQRQMRFQAPDFEYVERVVDALGEVRGADFVRPACPKTDHSNPLLCIFSRL